MTRNTTQVHALSFDVEEHFQVAAFWSPERRRHWDQYESRVAANVEKILEILSGQAVQATFFILGWVAQKHPSVVRKIAQAGHEIASHGFGHEMITAQTPGVFREDIRRSKDILENIIGGAVHGYRAPSFTITRDTKWALPALVEEGYVYDSSIFPIQHDRYGMPEANPRCHLLETSAGPLWEVPPTTMKVGPMRVPIAGGGYFRLYPYSLLRTMLGKTAAGGHPLVMYLHPWELDPEQPRMNGSLLSRFRHYINLGKTESRLRQLVTDFPFSSIRATFSDVAAACEARERDGEAEAGHLVLGFHSE